MNNLKFRCWSKGRNCWCRPPIKVSEDLDDTFSLWSPATEEGGEFVWMQYTGLKDKNGVEIYEGDIFNPKPYTFVEVKFLNGKYVGDDGSEIHDLYPHNKVMEVIGNVFDSPELLKD